MDSLDTEFFNHYIPLEKGSGEQRVHVYGAMYQRVRLVAALERCFERDFGDAIEIGCMGGKTSKLLAEVCQRYGRTLVCVDPWVNMPGYEWIDFEAHYPVFLEAIEPFKNNVQVIKLPSQDPDAIRTIQEREYAFAFVDGDHAYEPALEDLRTILPITTCAVASDDHRYDSRVQQANKQAAEEFPGWRFRQFADFREAWFLR